MRADNAALATDDTQRKLATITLVNGRPTALRLVPYEALISSDILRDDVSVARAERREVTIAPQAGAPAAPGSATPAQTAGVGALVGGVTTNASLRLSRLALRLTMDDVRGGDFVVELLKLERPELVTAFWLRPQVLAVEEWHTRIEQIIRDADEVRQKNAMLLALEHLDAGASPPVAAPAAATPAIASPAVASPAVASPAQPPKPQPPPTAKVLAELAQLASLFERGHITQKQFEAMRQQLLGV
jgi:hypothetical protein